MAEHNPADIAAANKLLSETCAYYKYTPGDMEADLWQLAMKEFGPLAVMRAIMEHVGVSDFMPKIGGIRRALGASSANTPLVAFERVRAEVERVGPYASPVFEDPAIGLAIQEMGGWVWMNEAMPSPEFRRLDYESMGKRFGVAYETARSRLNRGEAVAIECKGLHRISHEELGAKQGADRVSVTPRIS